MSYGDRERSDGGGCWNAAGSTNAPMSIGVLGMGCSWAAEPWRTNSSSGSQAKSRTHSSAAHGERGRRASVRGGCRRLRWRRWAIADDDTHGETDGGGGDDGGGGGGGGGVVGGSTGRGGSIVRQELVEL